jgi:hypothetical protein
MGEGDDTVEDADQPRAGDDGTDGSDPEPAQERARAAGGGPPAAEPRPQPPVDQALARLRGSLGGRTLSVYGVLLAGAAVLFLLLAIIWITAGGDGDGERPTCVNINVDQVLGRIEAAEVERVDVSFRAETPRLLPAVISLETTDGSCHIFQPQGIEGQVDMLAVIGAVEFYNETSDERRITLSIEPSDNLPPELFWTPTPTVTATVEPTMTVEATATIEAASPTAGLPTETAVPTVTATIESGSPDASPDVSPGAGSPTAAEPTPPGTPLG